MDPCKWNYLNAFFSWFRCLEMLLQVQWQRNFLTSCSLLLKCHDWWWLKFDGEHQISPQVLHGAQGWTFPHLCIVVFRSVRITKSCHLQQICTLRNWVFSNENVLSFVPLYWGREEEVRGFLPGLQRKLSSTKFQQTWQRGVNWVAWPTRRRRPRTCMWTDAVSCLRCLLVVFCVSWIC